MIIKPFRLLGLLRELVRTKRPDHGLSLTDDVICIQRRRPELYLKAPQKEIAD
jgi:hypothetical protein